MLCAFCSVIAAKIATQQDLILDSFVVIDNKTKGPLAPSRWAEVEKEILLKLNKRRLSKSATADPFLAEQVWVRKKELGSVRAVSLGSWNGKPRSLMVSVKQPRKMHGWKQ